MRCLDLCRVVDVLYEATPCFPQEQAKGAELCNSVLLSDDTKPLCNFKTVKGGIITLQSWFISLFA